MNTELYKMIVDAEGRYLTDEESARVREYAINMSARLEASRRLEQAEAVLVEEAVERFVEKYPEYVKRVEGAREKTARDMKLTIRYVAAAHVRQDPEFFRRSFASWTAEILRALIDVQVLVDGQTCLRDAMEKHLDAVDARAFVALHDIFLKELAR